MIAIYADGGGSLGFGHLARCLSISSALRGIGEEVAFIVSDEVSQATLAERGENAVVVGASRYSLREDTQVIGAAIRSFEPSCVLVDSYGVSDAFFGGLKADLGNTIRLAYIDDQYTFDLGIIANLHAWPVDMVINYGFSYEEIDYRVAYPKCVRLAVGPRFAPVQRGFFNARHELCGKVDRILITSGSTNPGGVLEVFVDVCHRVVSDAALEIVVGGASHFDEAYAQRRDVVHRGVSDLSPLFARCAMAVSAGGSTLYELSAAGIPAVAVPIVENQVENVRGYSRCGCGCCIDALDWSVSDVASAVGELARDRGRRQGMHERAMRMVDADGALRIALLLSARKGGSCA